MSTKSWIVVLGLVVLLGAATHLPQRTPAADPQEKDDIRDEEQDVEQDAEQLERRLDEIEELIDRAEQQGDRDRVRELRREGERLIDVLEQIERRRLDDEDDEDEFEEEEWDLEQRELEMQRLHLEIERLHAELGAVGVESAVRMAEIAESHLGSASYAIRQAVDHMEEEVAHEFLVDLLEESEPGPVRRLVQFQLARLSFHLDRPDEGLSQLRAVIRGK